MLELYGKPIIWDLEECPLLRNLFCVVSTISGFTVHIIYQNLNYIVHVDDYLRTCNTSGQINTNILPVTPFSCLLLSRYDPSIDPTSVLSIVH